MDKKITSNIVLGTFVLIGFGIFIWLIFNMGGGQGVFSQQFTLYGRFAQVKGLHFGSEVSLSGLRVGTVKGIAISADSTKELVVQLAVNRSVQEHLRKDSVAKVATQGILGDKYIELTIGTATEPALKDGDYITTAEPPDILSKSGTVVEEISGLLKKGNSLDQLIRNLNQVAENISVITGEIRHSKGMMYELVNGPSGEKLNKSMGHIEHILKKVDAGEGTLGALINDPTIYEDLKALLGGAKRSSILRYFMRSFIDSGSEKSQPKK